MSTIFTKIIKGDIPSYKVYEDEICYAFLDINPVTKGHTLVVPKEEYQWMTDTPDDIIAHMFVVSKQLMQNMIAKLSVDYVQVNVEGLEVPHFHIHLIPVTLGNNICSFQHVTYEEGEQEEILNKLST